MFYVSAVIESRTCTLYVHYARMLPMQVQSFDRSEQQRGSFEDYKLLLLDTHDERRALEALITRLEEGIQLL